MSVRNFKYDQAALAPNEDDTGLEQAELQPGREQHDWRLALLDSWAKEHLQWNERDGCWVNFERLRRASRV